MSLFDIGFDQAGGPPTPQNVAQLTARLAAVQGAAAGMAEKLTSGIPPALYQADQLASEMGDKISDQISGPIGDSAAVANAVTAKAHDALGAALKGPVETALGMGMQPQQLPTIAAAAQARIKRKGRSNKGSSVQQSTPPDGVSPPLPDVDSLDSRYLLCVDTTARTVHLVDPAHQEAAASAGLVCIGSVAEWQGLAPSQRQGVWDVLWQQLTGGPQPAPPPPVPPLPAPAPGGPVAPLPVQGGPVGGPPPAVPPQGQPGALPALPGAGMVPGQQGRPLWWPGGGGLAPLPAQPQPGGLPAIPAVPQQGPQLPPGAIPPFGGLIPLPGLPAPVLGPLPGPGAPVPGVPAPAAPAGPSVPPFPNAPIAPQPPAVPAPRPGGQPPSVRPPPVPPPAGGGGGGLLPMPAPGQPQLPPGILQGLRQVRQGAPQPGPQQAPGLAPMPGQPGQPPPAPAPAGGPARGLPGPTPAPAPPAPAPAVCPAPCPAPTDALSLQSAVAAGVREGLEIVQYGQAGQSPQEQQRRQDRQRREDERRKIQAQLAAADTARQFLAALQSVPGGPIAGPPGISCLPGAEYFGGLTQFNLKSWIKDRGLLDDQGRFAPWVIPDAEIDRASVIERPILRAVNAASVGLGWVLQNAPGWGQVLSSLGGCPDATVIGPAVLQWILHIADRWLGQLPLQFERSSEYLTNWSCPNHLPTTTEADQGYLAGAWDDAAWECLVRANGDRPDYYRKLRDAQRERPNVTDLIQLRRRGLVTQEQYSAAIRQLGVVTDEDRVRLEQSAEYTPSPSEIIQWMLKDVNDVSITSRFGLFDEFGAKYGTSTTSGPRPDNVPAGAPGTAGAQSVKDYFRGAGVSEQTALAEWAAHWRNMAPTQLYQMLHRLRKDKSGTTLLGGHAVPNTSLAVSYDDVHAALGQADYPPYWRDRLMAISYALLTRTDIRRSYETGTMTDDELVSALRDRGYTEQDARRLYTFYRRSVIQLASRRPAANAWVREGFSVDLLRQQLIDQGMRPDLWPDVESILQTRRRTEIQRACLKELRKAFDARLVNDTDVYTRLNGIGVQGPEALSLVNAWMCERDARHKLLQTAAIREMAQTGVYRSEQDVRVALAQLGYFPRDITRLIQSWELDISRLAQRRKALRKSMRDAEAGRQQQ